MSKKDNIIKLLYNISYASVVSFAVFLLIVFLSTLPALSSSFNAPNGMHILSILIIFSFFITLALSYGIRKSRETFIKFKKLFYKIKIPWRLLIKLKKHYPEVPTIVGGTGYLLLLIIFLVAINYPPVIMAHQIIFGAMGFLSVLFLLVGVFLFIASFYAIESLKGRVFFTLQMANEILDQKPIEPKKLKGYIYLIYKNIKNKNGRELNLKSHDNSISVLENTFSNLLPYYLEFAGEDQLQSLKNNLQTMNKSVNEEDEIDWIILTPTLLRLHDDITNFLENINIKLPYKKSQRWSVFVFRYRDTIILALTLAVTIILAIVGIYSYLHPPRP